MSYQEEYKDALSYIDSYWDKIIVKPKQFRKWARLVRLQSDRSLKHAIDLPNAFITPNDQKFRTVHYWDTYFMFRGLIGTKREWILKPMVDNFIYLFEKYGIIPNFSSYASLGRSQPPFLTSMILDAYHHPSFRISLSSSLTKIAIDFDRRRNWLLNAVDIAQQEYFNVWEDSEKLFNHKVDALGLNRYGDRDIGYAHSSELESGWDFTSRFYNRCNEFIPIDLNCYLYKYEKDFEFISKLTGNAKSASFWKKRASKRKELINKYMWNDAQGFFFDYNYIANKQSKFLSLAGFSALWAGVAKPDQAKRMVKALRYFNTDSGLTITAKKSLAPLFDFSNIPQEYRNSVEFDLKPKQWDYPYIWAPIEYLTVVGLLKYGFIKDATQIMKKSLAAHNKIFKEHKTFFEKIAGDTSVLPASFHYKHQTGFGWTNAVFYRYVRILDALEASDNNIYTKPKAKQPPYELSITV